MAWVMSPQPALVANGVESLPSAASTWHNVVYYPGAFETLALH